MFKCRDCGLIVCVEEWSWITTEVGGIVLVKNSCDCSYTASLWDKDLEMIQKSQAMWRKLTGGKVSVTDGRADETAGTASQVR